MPAKAISRTPSRASFAPTAKAISKTPSWASLAPTKHGARHRPSSSADKVNPATVVVADIDAIDPGLAFLDVAFKDLPDCRVVDAFPRNVLGREEFVVQGFRAVLAGDLQRDGAEDDVHLADLRHAEDRVG